MNRYLVIEPDQIIDTKSLERALTITNPSYAYQRDVLGIRASAINMPKEIALYTKLENGSIEIPRYAIEDPAVSAHIVNWLPIERIPMQLAKHNKWKNESKLREYQEYPCNEILNNKADIITANCGSGKTVMGTYIISRSEMPVCIVVHLDFLAGQWQSELLNFTSIPETGIVLHENNKLDLSLSAPIVIAKVQSLIRMPYDEFKHFYDRFKLSIFDEVHTMGSLEFHRVLSNFPCKRIGMTATPDRTDGFKSFKWCIGMREVCATGDQGVTAAVIGLDLGIPPISANKFMMHTRNGMKSNIAKLMNAVYAVPSRTLRVAQLAMQLVNNGRHVLLLSHRRENATELFRLLGAVQDKALMLGGMEDDGIHHQLIVATFQYVRMAFNRPRLDIVINTGIYTAFNDVKQSTGRILRSHPDKKRPIIIDVYEYDSPPISDGRVKPLPGLGPCAAMFNKRVAAYKKLGYEIANKRCTSVEEVINLVSTIERNG